MLKKTIAREYHRRSVGMYLLILFVAAGFLRGEEHVQIARLAMRQTEILMLIGVVWGVHVLKTSLFFKKMMQQPSYEFLYDVNLLAAKNKWTELVKMQINLNVVFLSYAVFMAAIGVLEKEWLGVFLLVVINIFFVLLPAWWENKFLQTPNASTATHSFFDKAFPRFSPPSVLFFSMFLLKKEPIYLLLQKLLSVFLIVAMAYVYNPVTYDERLLKLGLFFVSTGYFTLAQPHQEFYKSWLFSRNLPISTSGVVKQLLINAMVFTLPELLIFIVYLPKGVSPFVILDVYMYAVCLLLFWQTAIFWMNFTNARLNLLLFVSYAIIFVLLMFGVPLSLIGLAAFVISVCLLNAHYYSFEMTEE